MTDISARIEDFLIQGDWVFKKLNDETWTINDEFEGIDNLVIFNSDPQVIFRLKLMNIPSKNKEEFYEKMLRLNSESLIHGAYALEGDSVILVDSLEGENLDFNEFQASIDAIYMGITNDYKILKNFID